MLFIALISSLLLHLMTVTMTLTPQYDYNATDNLLLNCGRVLEGTKLAAPIEDINGRQWYTDAHYPNFLPYNFSGISTTTTASEQDLSVNRVPYMTGTRIMLSQFTYTFRVSPGAKFLRLYFYPADYSGYDKSESFFSVTANHFTLLSNFSAFYTVSASTNSSKAVRKEFVINVNETQILYITFSPSPNSYAFVNGIEIVSMPTNLYLGGDNHIKLVVSVTANQFTLLSNFSAFYTVSASNNSSKAVRKEFVINVNETQILYVTFSPSPNSYAFVNGIEIVSMPTNLYLGGDNHIKLVGQTDPYSINNNTALETLYRLNVGGHSVASTEDTGMYRVWDSDEEFVVVYGFQTPKFDVNITYTTETPPYVAPRIVYLTSRTMANNSQSLDWIFPLDSGFYYLFRLHFCQNQPEVNETNHRIFYIYIGKQTAEKQVGLSGGGGFTTYRDYVVFVRDPDVRLSKDKVWLELGPNMKTRAVYDIAMLNGLEIFKLSDPNGNLAVPYPEEGSIKSPPLPNNNNKKRISWHIIVAIIAGVTSGIVVFSILGFLISRRTGGKDHSTSIPKSSSLPSDLCRHFSIAEIKNATDNFDEKFVIGYGGFGNVYKGYLDNGTITVAVKRSNPSSKQGIREFQTEIEMLSSKLRHRQLVSLIGYCDDKNEMILVYDYMANGTLRDHLYNTDNAPLPWKKRLDICIGAAKGLYYLHSGTKHTIIHRDVKSTNILLDDKWVAKVSDFGLSKVGSVDGTDTTHVSTAVKGSFGYVDPEYYKRQRLTVKSDVYSFGAVLFEVLCGRPAINPNLPTGQVNLAEWACRSCEKRNVEEIIDPNLKGQIAPECLSKFAELAYHCLREQGVERPSMGDVVRSLEFALQLQEGADNEVDGYVNPSFPLIINGDANVRTNEDEISEVERKLTSNGISMSVSRSAKLNNVAIFSEIVNPLGR
ncbi:receptor-like protein kinase FERONIA [Solanum stenotomum]|uniref:receptor-like protein kinase FERONIA n=1 Tax=Solanum stenotomum TaxID=172797 RepID=UPI0020D0988C|nr:receptor-like protein kinase FERONIA [Solanum stenotomum]